MKMRDELKPCPFCGSELYRSPRSHNPKAYCVTEDCYGKRISVVNLDDEVCVAKWNTRATPPAVTTSEQVKEALEKARKYIADESENDGVWSTKDAFEAMTAIDAALSPSYIGTTGKPGEQALREGFDRKALADVVYAALRFAEMAAGEGIFFDDLDPGDFLSRYCEQVGADDYDGIAGVAKAALTLPAVEDASQRGAGVDTDEIQKQLNWAQGEIDRLLGQIRSARALLSDIDLSWLETFDKGPDGDYGGIDLGEDHKKFWRDAISFLEASGGRPQPLPRMTEAELMDALDAAYPALPASPSEDVEVTR